MNVSTKDNDIQHDLCTAREMAAISLALPSCAVVIPAYNEELVLAAIIARIRVAVPGIEVVVIDDGSTDQTAAIASAANATVLKHPYNKGNGAAVKTALRNLAVEHIVIIDADGQHPPELIPALIEKLAAYDLVIAARTKGSDSLRHRKLANWIFCHFASFLAEQEIPDLTSGFRAFNRRKALEFMHLYPNGFSFPATSTLAFTGAGYSVKFLPAVFPARHKDTQSKIRPFKDGTRFLLMIVRITTMISPLRIFVPGAVFSLIMGIIWITRTLLFTGQVSSAGAFLVGAGINILFFGIVVDQLVSLRLRSRD